MIQPLKLSTSVMEHFDTPPPMHSSMTGHPVLSLAICSVDRSKWEADVSFAMTASAVEASKPSSPKGTCGFIFACHRLHKSPLLSSCPFPLKASSIDFTPGAHAPISLRTHNTQHYQQETTSSTRQTAHRQNGLINKSWWNSSDSGVNRRRNAPSS